MKSRVLLFAILFISFCSLFAQSPEGFNYQAVIRNNAGEVLSNQSVGIRMTLIQGTANGTVVYRETFTRTTNSFGLIDLVIGQGSATTGSFSTIDWSAGPYFMETAVDQNGGSNYTALGTSQLMSVPFAMYAANSASDGADGQDGATGKSAYEIWLEAGNTGSEADFLTSLVGEAGPAGADGADGQDGSGLTPSIQAEIDANTAKVGITTDQANAILTNSADPDVDETNEIQTLSISDDQLSLSNGGGSVTIPTSADNSDTNELQTISRADEFVVLSNSGGIASIEDDDADPANELQTISRADEFVVLSNSGGMASIEDDDADPANEIQTLSISDDQLSLSNGGGSVTIPTSADNSTTNELITSVVLSGTTLEITDAGGMAETNLASLVNDADADPANELISSVVLNGTDLEVTDAGGTISADLSSLTAESDPVFVASDASAIAASDIANWNAVHSAYDSNGGFDDADADPANELQEISTDATPGNITITDGATLTLNVEDADADPENEIQDLEVIGDTLLITGNSNPTKILLGGRNSYGDIKHSLRLTDHEGWYKLDGRALSALPETAAQIASDFFVGNLPDATDRFLKGNDGVENNGDVGGSNAITIAQGNLENFNLTVSEDNTGSHNHTASSSSAGNHSHTIASIKGVGSTDNRVVGGDDGASDGNKSTNSAGSHTHSITVNDNGDHVHNVAVSSGGSGTPIPKPSYLATNIFVYLGSATLEDLQNLGLSNEDILASGISPLTLWNDDNNVLNDLLGLDYNGSTITYQTFVDQGIDIPFLYNQYGQTLLDETSLTTLNLFNAGVAIAEMDGNGILVSTMRTDGISMGDIHASGLYSFQDLRDGGFPIEEIVTLTDYQTMVDQGVATYAEFLAVPTSTLTLWNANNMVLTDLLGLPYLSGSVSLQTFVDETIPLSFLYGEFGINLISQTTATSLDLFNDGVTIAEMSTDGVGLAVMVADGITLGNLDASGVFTLLELKAAGYTVAEFYAEPGITVQEILNEDAFTIQELRANGATTTDFHGVAYGGGLIFLTTLSGDAYVASLTDQSSGVRWANNGTANSAGGSIGDGLTNTTNMLAFDDGSTNGPNAATVCTGDINGFSDWFLPSRNELREVYDNLFDKAAFVYDNTAIYWSSTATSTSQCRAIDFSDGSTIDNQVRTLTHKVRAIRFIPGD